MLHELVAFAAADTVFVADRWVGCGPTIVLLQAGVGDRRAWREVGARLGAAGRDVVAYDQRRFRDAPATDAPFRLVDDLLAVVDAVSPAAPAWLVGSSTGGQVALDAAREAPHRVAGLVLLAPAVGGGIDGGRRVDEITASVLVACGDLDLATTIQQSVELVDELPNASYHGLPGVAQLPYLEAPMEIAQLISAHTCGR